MQTELGHNTSSITLTELQTIIKRLKRRKSPAPDEVPIEICKEIDDEVSSLI